MIELKEKYIRERLENSEKIKYIGLHNDLNKSIVNMKDGIQIDDVYDELKSNARYKILIKNYIETDYNHIKDIRNDSLCVFYKDVYNNYVLVAKLDSDDIVVPDTTELKKFLMDLSIILNDEKALKRTKSRKEIN